MSGIRLIDCKQRSQEWFAIRCGRVTASRIKDVTAKRKTGKEEMQCRKDYRTKLLVERLTNTVQENYVSAEMIWGMDHEDEARRTYEALRDAPVELTGFYLHPTIDQAGASPDGLVNHNGLIEIKCPSSTTHLTYLVTPNVLIEEYFQQCQWEMACTGRSWCDLVSYDPRMPEVYQLLIQRVERDDGFIASLEAEVLQFLEEVEEALAKLPTEVAV